MVNNNKFYATPLLVTTIVKAAAQQEPNSLQGYPRKIMLWAPNFFAAAPVTPHVLGSVTSKLLAL